MDQRSLPDQLVFSIGCAVSRSRDLLRDILKQHVSDGPREQLGKRVVEHLELSGFEVDEEGQALRKKPPVKDTGEAAACSSAAYLPPLNAGQSRATPAPTIAAETSTPSR